MGDLGSSATARRGLTLARSLRRLWRYHPFVVVVAAVVTACGAATLGVTLASFTAVTRNDTSTFASGWVGPATSLSVTPSGYDGQLGWVPGTHGPVTGQQLWGYDNGSSSSCPSVGYTQLSTLGSASTSSYTDSHATNALNGHYYCYEIISTSATTWTATANFPATQLGLVATSVSITNAVAGTLRTNDTIVVTYNQQPTLTALANTKVCAAWSAGTAPVPVTIFLDYGTCSVSNTAYQVKITGLTKGTTGSVTAGTGSGNVTIAVATSAPWTVTYTVTQNLTLGMNSGTATAVPDGGGNVKSAVTTDQANACTDPTYNCTPSTSTTL